MHHFAYRNGVMHCEDVSLEAIAREVGTPCYVYSDATLRRHYNVLAEAFANRNVLIAYAVKANSNLGVIATLASMGAGADVVSGGELSPSVLQMNSSLSCFPSDASFSHSRSVGPNDSFTLPSTATETSPPSHRTSSHRSV